MFARPEPKRRLGSPRPFVRGIQLLGQVPRYLTDAGVGVLEIWRRIGANALSAEPWSPRQLKPLPAFAGCCATTLFWVGSTLWLKKLPHALSRACCGWTRTKFIGVKGLVRPSTPSRISNPGLNYIGTRNKAHSFV